MDQLVEGCIRASACGVQTYPYLGNCLDAYFTLYRSQGVAPIYDRLYACVNAAKEDCTAVSKCFRRGAACDKDSRASCDGAIATSCDLIDQRFYGIDCAQANLKCAVPTGTQKYSAACAQGTCDGSKSVTCVHGKEHHEDCSKRTYRKTACSQGSCVVSGTECTSSINRCAGAKLEACMDGNWKQFDCAAMGLGPCKPGSTIGANCSRPSI